MNELSSGFQEASQSLFHKNGHLDQLSFLARIHAVTDQEIEELVETLGVRSDHPQRMDLRIMTMLHHLSDKEYQQLKEYITSHREENMYMVGAHKMINYFLRLNLRVNILRRTLSRQGGDFDFQKNPLLRKYLPE